MPEARWGYDFGVDAVFTEVGNEGYRSFAERLPREGCEKAWTILVYMAADSVSMPPYAYLHLHEMEAAFEEPALSAASTVDADVVVELDLDAPEGRRRLYMVRADVPYEPRRFLDVQRERSPLDIRSPIVELLPEDEGLSKAEELRRFVDWGVRSYPARHYMVVVWGHGQGFRPAGASGPVRYDPRRFSGGIAFDDHPAEAMDVLGLGEALSSVARERLGGRRFDVYASDACLMQSLEVASELSDVARYVVGSEQIESYLGFAYRRFLPWLNGSAGAPLSGRCGDGDAVCWAAALLPEATREAFLPGGMYAELSPEGRETYTLSALDSDALRVSLLPALERLSAGLSNWIVEDPLRRIDLQVLLDVDGGRGAGGGGVPGFWGSTRDVGVFLSALEGLVRRQAGRSPMYATYGTEALLEGVREARSALSRSVLASAFGERYASADYAGMAGVSVWLPHDEAEFEERIGFFSASRLYTSSLWPQWLSHLFRARPGANAGGHSAPYGPDGAYPTLWPLAPSVGWPGAAWGGWSGDGAGGYPAGWASWPGSP